MSYVFWRVPSSIKLRPEKKVQSFGRWLECLGVPSARIVSAGSLIKLGLEKKVQLSGHWLQCRIVLVGSLLCFLAGSSIKLQITTGKKRYSHLALSVIAACGRHHENKLT